MYEQPVGQLCTRPPSVARWRSSNYSLTITSTPASGMQEKNKADLSDSVGSIVLILDGNSLSSHDVTLICYNIEKAEIGWFN